MDSTVKTGRGYSTRLRQEQVDLTRRRVLEAARRLFLSTSFSDVTMHAVATEAGVAYQTVYAQFRNKLNLALELCTSEFPHVGSTVALLVQARDRGDADAWLRMMGTFARRLYEPCAEILRFMRQSGEPNLLARYNQIESGRMERLRDLGPQLEKTGRLRPGLSAAQAVDLVWLLSGPETYESLVLDRGWAPERVEAWLNETLAQLVLVNA